MAITGVGSINSYVYNAGTKQIHLQDGTDNDFTSWFNGEKEEAQLSDKINGYDYSNLDVLRSSIDWYFHQVANHKEWMPIATGEDKSGNEIYDVTITNTETWETVINWSGDKKFTARAATWLKPGEKMVPGRPYYNTEFSSEHEWDFKDEKFTIYDESQVEEIAAKNTKIGQLYKKAMKNYEMWWDIYEDYLESPVNKWEEEELKRLDIRDRSNTMSS